MVTRIRGWSVQSWVLITSATLSMLLVAGCAWLWFFAGSTEQLIESVEQAEARRELGEVLVSKSPEVERELQSLEEQLDELMLIIDGDIETVLSELHVKLERSGLRVDELELVSREALTWWEVFEVHVRARSGWRTWPIALCAMADLPRLIDVRRLHVEDPLDPDAPIEMRLRVFGPPLTNPRQER